MNLWRVLRRWFWPPTEKPVPRKPLALPTVSFEDVVARFVVNLPAWREGREGGRPCVGCGAVRWPESPRHIIERARRDLWDARIVSSPRDLAAVIESHALHCCWCGRWNGPGGDRP